MFPVGDDQVASGPPKLVTAGLIVLNVLVFLFELSKPSEAALQSFNLAGGELDVVRTIGYLIPS